MKMSKPPLQSSSQEKCGVWLDTAQLKRKGKKKQLFCPISKLLNPLAEGDGYSLAVALDFTQTKIQMPNTKQSSIYSFFSPQHRVLDKMSISEDPRRSPAGCKWDSSTSDNLATSTKRKYDEVCKLSHVYNTGEPKVKTPRTDLSHKGNGLEMKSQSGMKNATPFTKWDHRPREAEADLNEQERIQLLAETSLNAVESDPHRDVLSENPLSYSCSSQNGHKLMESINLLGKTADGESAVPECTSPGNIQPWREILYKDTLDKLFTQDSEGFRVIAHRDLPARGPLKDHTNLDVATEKGTITQKSFAYEEEEEMLFTQDSQGNTVIKH